MVCLLPGASVSNFEFEKWSVYYCSLGNKGKLSCLEAREGAESVDLWDF